ncbi:MAG: adenylate/guanylate cyclase domain-containing protein [Gammaproteobacteria bacterium]|nr:adenylate/guanylate cyclase domain-containing protein [Gammaproteobacteria bacterium]
MQKTKLVRHIFSALIVLLFLFHSLEWFRLDAINRLELAAYDMQLRQTLPGGIDKRIVIIDIDEDSLESIGQWPWSRNIMASLVDNLFDHYKVNVTGFDIVFAEPDTSSGLNILEKLGKETLLNDAQYQETLAQLKPQLHFDEIFARSLNNRKVVLGYVFNSEAERRQGKLPAPISEIDKKWGERLFLSSPAGYTGNLALLQDNALTGGFFDNPRVDSDGVFRRVPVLQKHQNQLYGSLAFEVARLALDNPRLIIRIPSKDTEDQGYFAIEYLELGKHTIPVDENISVLVPFRGGKGSFPYVSAAAVLNKTAPIDLLKNKIVLIGTTAPGLLDLRSTPVQNIYPGVEVHANIVAGILDNRILHHPAYLKAYEVLTLLIIGLVLIFLTPALNALFTSLLTLSIITLLASVTALTWHYGQMVLPIAASLCMTILLFIFHMTYGFFVESRDKRELTKIFGQYVPPELVDEMAANPDDISMESQSREMTVLFSDIRGFTSISENLDPKKLSELMNAFLTPMTRTIHKHRGTIDKYMGDAIMAFWGAPLADPHHVKNALLASLEMQKLLDELQAEFKNRGWPPIRIGIGINTGTMNVGNMGSEFRMAYTVIGDAVNLASRIEGLTKQYQVDIIVGEAVQKALPEFEYFELDRVRVKGKDRPVTIYQPLGFSIEMDKDLRTRVRRFNKALILYRQQNWDGAEREIFSLSQEDSNRYLYKLYLDRIMYFRNHPPGQNWDGVFTHTTK